MNEVATMKRDTLTGLPGREDTLRQLEIWLSAGLDAGAQPVHAMMVGLGRFETVNLAYGEATGDGALAEIARRLLHFGEDEFELSDWLVARLGGGKFLLGSRGECSRERWQWLAEALADAIALPIAAVEAAASLHLWPRIALIRAGRSEATRDVLDRLAETIGRMENQPGRRVEWVDRKRAPAGLDSARLEADLFGAMDRGEIEVRFQPQFSLADGGIVGAEALARWNHPTLGLIGAGPLFAIAQRVDQTSALSRHVAETALATAAGWPCGLRLSLNVTPSDLSAPSFARQFLGLLEEAGFSAERLTLEITEQVLLADLERTAGVLEELAAVGVSIALDDFGAGFCNFRYLKILPLAAIKLDRAMVEGIADDPRDLAVLRGIIAMANALELSVVAEGIDSEAKRAIVAAEGCETYQGYLGAKPMTASVFAALVARRA